MTGTADADELVEALAEALEPVLGTVRIEDLRRLSGGASRETWSFLAVRGPGDADRQALVLQRTRPGLTGTVPGPSMVDEDRLLDAARARGVPVPPTVLPASAAGPLGEARVTRHVEGETLGRRIVRDDGFAAARRVLVRQCGEALAAIHAVDPDEVGGLRVVEPVERLRSGLDLLEVARPAFELALHWLGERAVPAGPARVVHGDFRLGNLIVGPAGLAAVLDWELAHLGDPVEDLGWLCVRSWRFGGEGVVAGIGGPADLLDAYAAAGGARVDPEHLRWWIVAGTLTWGLICAVQARRHLDGHVRSVELAAIGRRLCETEYDLLQLLDVPPGDAPGPPPELATGPLVVERPTAAELVEAVRAHLEGEVAPALEGAAAFQLRVAANALAIVERELLEGPAAARAAARRFERIGVADEIALAAGLRDRSVEATPEVLAAVRAAVVDRLRIADPRWLQPPDTGR